MIAQIERGSVRPLAGFGELSDRSPTAHAVGQLARTATGVTGRARRMRALMLAARRICCYTAIVERGGFRGRFMR